MADDRTTWQVGTALLAAAAAVVAVQRAWPEPTFDGALVEVMGDVPHPGLHVVDALTVHAALRAAGVDPAGRPDGPLEYGDRLAVHGAAVELGPPSDPLLVGRLIDLNRAPAAALASVPGVSDAQADAIVAYRDARGPFASLAAVDAVPGVGPATVARLTPYVAAP